MKKLINLAACLLLLGCTKEDDNTSTTDQLPEGVIEIRGEVKMPEEANIDANSLTVQSFTDFQDVSNETYAIQIADQNFNNLYAVDDTGKVWLMGVMYPNQTSYTINTETTVIAMLMNFPIVQNLSVQGKLDFMNDVKNSPNFPSIVNELENLIERGVSPLEEGQDAFVSNLYGFFENRFLENKAPLDKTGNATGTNKTSSETYEGPITIYQAGNEFIFQNPGNGYTSYVGIYKTDPGTEETVQYAYFPLQRVTFIPTSISEALGALVTGPNDAVEIVEESLSLSEPGTYEIIARSGKSFPDETEEAMDAYAMNLADVALDVFFELIPSEGNDKLECIQTITGNFRSYVALASQSASANDSPLQTLFYAYDLVDSYLSNIIVDVNLGALNCQKNDNAAFYQYLQTIKKKIKWLKYTSVIGTSGNLIFGVVQWHQNEATMDLCFTVTENNIYECQPGLTVSGDLNFGEVPVGVSAERTLTIENQADFAINLASLNLPEGFNVQNNPGSVPPEESIELTISFLPTQLQDYSGELTIVDDIDKEHIVEIVAISVPAFQVSGSLNFGKVDLHGPPAEATISITNISEEIINVNTSGWPDILTYSWSSGPIEPNTTQNIEVMFFPQEIQTYTGTVTVSNDASEIREEIGYSITVVEGGGVSLSGSLDFGDVPINTTETRTLNITNDSFSPVEILSLSMPSGFTYSGNPGVLQSQETKEVTIQFAPGEEQTYSGNITVYHTGSEENSTINVSGTGVKSSEIDLTGTWNLGSGTLQENLNEFCYDNQGNGSTDFVLNGKVTFNENQTLSLIDFVNDTDGSDGEELYIDSSSYSLSGETLSFDFTLVNKFDNICSDEYPEGQDDVVQTIIQRFSFEGRFTSQKFIGTLKITTDSSAEPVCTYRTINYECIVDDFEVYKT